MLLVAGLVSGAAGLAQVMIAPALHAPLQPPRRPGQAQGCGSTDAFAIVKMRASPRRMPGGRRRSGCPRHPGRREPDTNAVVG